MIYLQAYLWATTLISVAGMIKLPTKMNAVDAVGGSIVAGVAFGWLIWPFVIAAYIKTRRCTIRDRYEQ